MIPVRNHRPLLVVPAMLVIAGSVFLFIRSRRETAGGDNQSVEPISIEKRLQILFQAEQDGAIDRYHSCFETPAVRQGLDPKDKKRIKSNLAAVLRPANANQQSFAIIEKRLSDDGSKASLILVKIFPDREE